MSNFKIIKITGSLAIFFFLITGIISSSSSEEKKQKLYTAFNLWSESSRMFFINYKVGKMLPAGTEISKFEIIEDFYDPKLYFKTKGGNFSLSFNDSWYRSQTLESISKKLFTAKNFQELTAGMSEKEIDGVKRGTPVVGMTKKEVIIAFGYPPEHKTKSLKLNRWRYWIDRRRKIIICFDEKELAQHCVKPDDIWKR